jgi:hypothetical protein
MKILISTKMLHLILQYVGLLMRCWCLGLEFLEGNVNSELYVTLLEQKFIPSSQVLVYYLNKTFIL